ARHERQSKIDAETGDERLGGTAAALVVVFPAAPRTLDGGNDLIDGDGAIQIEVRPAREAFDHRASSPLHLVRVEPIVAITIHAPDEVGGIKTTATTVPASIAPPVAAPLTVPAFASSVTAPAAATSLSERGHRKQADQQHDCCAEHLAAKDEFHGMDPLRCQRVAVRRAPADGRCT